MDKQQDILDEIHRTGLDGKALGEQKFRNETGIVKRDWFPDYWLNWGEALEEAGFSRNKFGAEFDKEWMISQFISLIREKNHYPIQGEILRKKKRDKTFPSYNALFNGLGNKAELAAKVIAYCSENSGYEDIIAICEPIAIADSRDEVAEAESKNVDFGYVYLMKSGRYYTIGKANHTGRRNYEHERKLPEKIKTIHKIQTDDPFGVEEYWHNRFEEKRTETNGSWYDLDANDVKAFKRWKRIF
jgi:hypothetical protein